MEKIRITPDSCTLPIEPQNGFTKLKGSFQLDGEEAIDNTNILMDNTPWSVVSVDWHLPDNDSFKLFGTHCVPGTWDCKLHPKLKLMPIRAIFMKGTRKEDNIFDSFEIPGFREYLRYVRIDNLERIKRLFVTGSAIPYCPSETAISGARKVDGFAFDTYLVWDACVVIPGTDAEKEKKRLEAAGVKVITMADIALK